jgi:hypothetical protein
MIKKHILLSISGLVSIGLLTWNYVGNYRLCDFFMKGSSEGNCPFILTNIGTNLLPIIPLFLLSLITYKMQDEVYRAWLRFSYVWISLSMIAIFLAPEYSTDWMFPVVKGTVAFFSSLLFVVISLILIGWKHFSLRRP